MATITAVLTQWARDIAALRGRVKKLEESRAFFIARWQNAKEALDRCERGMRPKDKKETL